MLTYIKDSFIKTTGKRKRVFALYSCSYCKKEVEKNKDNITYRNVDNCGCQPKKLKPLPKEINSVRIVSDLGMDEKFNKRKAIFKCHCGKDFEAIINAVKTKQKMSCGCLRGGHNYTHQLSKHPLYRKWSGMIARTENKKGIGYHRYGGRGISVCREWRNDFMSFYDWAINNGWDEGLTIDRIDVNGNYEPSNCQWITMKENNIKDRKVTILNKFKKQEILKRYQTENITVTKLANEYGTYKKAISDIIKQNNLKIENRRLKCYQKL